jgi:microcystin-dependent protein
MDFFIGQIMMFGGTFAPRDWAFCDGQLLPIAQHQALFSILGTTYGGDGRTTFALPDLRGRLPIHAGSGPGLSSRKLGSKGGDEKNTLAESQMPAHHHDVTVTARCINAAGNVTSPAGHVCAVDAGGSSVTYSDGTADSNMNAGAIEVQQQNKGANQAINNMPPYLTVNYIICLEGIFPSRS